MNEWFVCPNTEARVSVDQETQTLSCVSTEDEFVIHCIPLGLLQRALERTGLLKEWAQDRSQ